MGPCSVQCGIGKWSMFRTDEVMVNSPWSGSGWVLMVNGQHSMIWLGMVMVIDQWSGQVMVNGEWSVVRTYEVMVYSPWSCSGRVWYW